MSPVGASVGPETPMSAIGRALYLQGHEQEAVEPGERWNASDPSPVWAAVHVIK